MSAATWNLTDAAQKEVSRLKALINKQKEIITKEEAATKDKGDSYICIRAANSLDFHKRKCDNAESDYKTHVERLERQYREDKAHLEKVRKDCLDKHEADIKAQEAIIHNERTKKSPTTTRAEAEIQILRDKLNKFESSLHSQPPLTQATEEVDNSEMMTAFRQEMPEKPLTFITNNFSYCSRNEAKEINKGMQGLIPAATNYDSSIYGPVATLKRPVKSVKV
jgi:hypothetical protein